MAYDERWQGLGNAARLVNLEGMEFREYQYNITKSILKGLNTLVILPTGLGKTLIAVFAIANAVANGKKALLLAPTKPLCEQHYDELKRMMKVDPGDILLLTGTIAKGKRKELESLAKVIVATPQTFANDLRSSDITIGDFSVAVFDECHRAVGKYAYTYIANECYMHGTQMIGLTASPGSRKDKIKMLLDVLKVQNIEMRLSTDSDVMQYVMPKYIHFVDVEKSATIDNVTALLKPMILESVTGLQKMGLFYAKNFEHIPKGRLIELGNEIRKISAKNYKYAAIYQYVRLLNLIHAYDLIETEGLYAFSQYMETLASREKKSRAVSSLLNSKNMIIARSMVDAALRSGEEHPKVKALLGIMEAYKGKKAIVFAQYRSTIKMLAENLQKAGYSARAFVGKKEGVTQEQQKMTISDFREGKFDILVSTSIGEEGLDIPTVDLVVFYEPIPSEIRNIQRRGRTGRKYSGEVIILVTKDTKDQIYYFVSKQREKKMAYIINKLSSELKSSAPGDGQKRL